MESKSIIQEETMFSYKDLAFISGEKINTLAVRVKRLKIKGVILLTKELYFDKNQAFRILNAHKKIDIKNNPVKIEAVEMYLSRMGVKKTALVLRISEDAIFAYAKEYKQTGYLVVESKLNLNILEL